MRPSYLDKHKDVLRENERVNVLGEWAHGFFTISFVGALNVGSIKLLFDEELKTNLKKPKQPYMSDKNYQTLNESSGAFLTFPIRKKKELKGISRFDPITEKEEFGVSKYLNEFDVKDIIDISQGKTLFDYDPSLENKLSYNIINGFRSDALSATANSNEKD